MLGLQTWTTRSGLREHASQPEEDDSQTYISNHPLNYEARVPAAGFAHTPPAKTPPSSTAKHAFLARIVASRSRLHALGPSLVFEC